MNKDKIKSFWDENHPNSKYADKLQELVPISGECENEIAEKFRCGVRVFYDFFNNGLCNMWDGDYYWNCLDKAHSYVMNHDDKIVSDAIHYIWDKIESHKEAHDDWSGFDWCDCEEYEEYGDCGCIEPEPAYYIGDVSGVNKDKIELAMEIFLDAIVVKATKELFDKEIELDKDNLILYGNEFMKKEEKSKSSSEGKVKVKLTGTDGNALAIVGKVARALENNGQREEAKTYRKEALSGDYNNVLITSMKYAEIS